LKRPTFASAYCTCLQVEDLREKLGAMKANLGKSAEKAYRNGELIGLLTHHLRGLKMNDQEQHDLQLQAAMRNGKLLEPGSGQRLEALLAKKETSSSENEPSSELGPIERAMREHPGLTREMAEKMADAFGF